MLATSTSGLLTEGEPSFIMISEKRRFTGHYIVLRTSNFEGSAGSGRKASIMAQRGVPPFIALADNTNETTDSQVRTRRKNRITATLTLESSQCLSNAIKLPQSLKCYRTRLAPEPVNIIGPCLLRHSYTTYSSRFK